MLEPLDVDGGVARFGNCACLKTIVRFPHIDRHRIDIGGCLIVTILRHFHPKTFVSVALIGNPLRGRYRLHRHPANELDKTHVPYIFLP